MKSLLVFLLSFLLVPLVFSQSEESSPEYFDSDLIFTSTLYPVGYSDWPSEKFLNHLPMIALFRNGLILFSGNDSYAVAENPSDKGRVVSAIELYSLDTQRLEESFSQILSLPKWKSDTYDGLICDRLHDHDHEVCRPLSASHEVLDNIRQDLVDTISDYTTYTYLPYRLYYIWMEVPETTDYNVLDEYIIEELDEFGFDGGYEYSESWISLNDVDYNILSSIWSDSNSETVYQVEERYFTFISYLPGYSVEYFSVPPFDDHIPSQIEYHHVNMFWIIILANILLFSTIAIVIIRRRRMRKQTNVTSEELQNFSTTTDFSVVQTVPYGQPSYMNTNPHMATQTMYAQPVLFYPVELSSSD